MAITIQEQKNSRQNKKDFGIIRHDAPLTATEVTDLKALLTRQFELTHDVIVEFTGLTDCDTLGLQLLLSASKSAKAGNSRFELRGDIEALQLAAQRIGLSFEDYFNCAAQTEADQS
ncbi:MAG: STAS domain-containing protein [Desulfamplus sp.]|nr:STAS domain-containing protein [Desulfamplus sp.]